MKKIFYLIPILLLGLFLAPKNSHAAIIVSSTFAPTSTITIPDGSGNAFGMIFDATTTTSGSGDLYIKFHAASSTIGTDYGMLGWLQCNNIGNTLACYNADGWSTDGSTMNTNVSSLGVVSTLNNQDIVLRYSGRTWAATDAFTIFYYQSTPTAWGKPTSTINPSYPEAYGCVASTLASAWACGGSAGGSSALNFLLPTNGTTTPLFSNFLLSASGITSTNSYYVQIKYYIPQVTPIKSISKTMTGSQIASSGVELSYDPFVLDSASTSSFLIANATLFDITNFNRNNDISVYAIATSTVVFTVITPSLDSTVGTSTYLDTHIFNNGGTLAPSSTPILNPYGGMLIPVVGSSTYYCQTPNNLLDIGGGMTYAFCAAGKFFFVSDSNFSGYWDDSLKKFQTAFPFSVVFGIHDIITNVASTTSGQSEETVKVSLAGVSRFFPSSTPDIVFLSSSTLTNLVGQSNKELIFGIEDAILWLMFCFGVYGMVAHGKKK